MIRFLYVSTCSVLCKKHYISITFVTHHTIRTMLFAVVRSIFVIYHTADTQKSAMGDAAEQPKPARTPEHPCSGVHAKLFAFQDQSISFSTEPFRMAFMAANTTLWLMVESLISVAE